MKTILKAWLIFLAIMSISSVQGQVVISEISGDGRIELMNTGTEAVDVSNYWLCNRPAYSTVVSRTLECGDLLIEGGETVTISGFNLNRAGDELGLYTNSNFGSSAGLIDYVIWGNRSGGTREAVAVSANLWTNGERAPEYANDESLNRDGDGENAAAWTVGGSSICEMTTTTCEVESGVIELSTGGTEVTICVDGNPDPLEVIFTEMANGDNSGYIITDDQDNILGLPMSGPFDLDGAGIGTCFIRAVSYQDDFTGASVGNNLSDLEGCFELSNPIKVYRQSPDGGQLSLLDGTSSLMYNILLLRRC